MLGFRWDLMKLLFFVTLLLLSQNSFSNFRKCLLLPVEVDANSSDQIYQDIRSYLTRSNWCYFIGAPKIYDIIKNYRPNLSSHLNNVDVRRLISQKSGSSSVIFISKNNDQINLQVFDESENYNFVEKYPLSLSTEKLSREIQNSLETYKKIIPYHGLVLNKGNGFITMTGGKEFNVLPGGEVQIFKKSEKITHPLYKTTLQFKKEKVCDGLVEHSDYGMAIVKINNDSKGCKSILRNDWVSLNNVKSGIVRLIKSRFNFSKKLKKKSIGKITLLTGPGTQKVTSSNASTSNIVSGYGGGISLAGNLLLTQKVVLFSGLELNKSMMSAETDGGQDQSPLSSHFYFGGGYRQRLLENVFSNFYVDLNGGFRYRSIPLDVVASDLMTGLSFYGIFLGGKLFLSLNKKIDLFSSFEFSVSPGVGQDVTIFSGDVSGSDYEFNLGINFKKLWVFDIFTMLRLNAQNANFEDVNGDIKVNNLALQAGFSIYF